MNPRPMDKPQSISPRQAAWAAFILASAWPLALCAGKLNNELWTDEVYTLTMFASVPLDAAAGDYSAPNNHILYSQGLHGWLALIGTLRKAEFMLRLPNLALATATLAGTFVFGWRWRGMSAAVAGTVLLGMTQMFLGHAMQLRGYGLSMALAAWLSALALPVRDPTPLRGGVIALLGAAALYTVPTNLLWLAPLGACAVVGVAARQRRWQQASAEATAWLAAFVVAAALYLPIYREVLSVGGQAPSDRWTAAAKLAANFFSVALRDAAWPIKLLAIGGAVLELRRRADQRGLALAAGTVVGTFFLAGALGISPFVRNLCPLLPPLAAGLGALISDSISAMLNWVQRRRGVAWPAGVHAAWAGAVIAVVLLPAVHTYPWRLSAFRLDRFAQDGYFNYYEAHFHPAQLVKALRDAAPAEEGYLLMIPDEDNFTISYYLDLYGVKQRVAPPAGAPQAVRVYAVVAPQTDLKTLLSQWQLPADWASQASVTADVGYFRLVRWPKLWPLANWGPTAENRSSAAPHGAAAFPASP